jgi:hydroxyacylglutathione hydrolase
LHIVTLPPAPSRVAGTSLTVHCVPLGVDNLGWLLAAPDGAAMAVDGPSASPYLALCDALGLRLAAVLNTHAHGDHVGLNRDLLARGQLSGLRVIGPAALAAVIPGLREPLANGDHFMFGGEDFEAIATPGHVDGHMAFHVGDALFTGDALFAGGCGRMFDGPAEVMQASLASLAARPLATRVFCAHEYTRDNLRFAVMLEPDNAALQARLVEVEALRAEGRAAVPSTLGLERATNPFLRWDSIMLRASLSRMMPERVLDSEVAVFAATRHLKDGWRAPPQP